MCLVAGRTTICRSPVGSMIASSRLRYSAQAISRTVVLSEGLSIQGYSYLCAAIPAESCSCARYFFLIQKVRGTFARENASRKRQASSSSSSSPLSAAASPGCFDTTPRNILAALRRCGRLRRRWRRRCFFAGEVTNSDGHTGTVHGAIARGWRAAHEILRSSLSAMNANN